MTQLLHFGDCVDFMKTLPDGTVDLAVYDPPYKTIKGGTPDDSRRPTGILEANDGKIFAMNDIQPKDYLPELYRVMSIQSHMYMMTNMLGLTNGILEDVKAAGFKLHNLLVWRKNNVTPNRWYMKDLEYTILARKGKALPINNPGSRSSELVQMHELDLVTEWDPDADFPYALDHDNVKSPKPHPTAKPVSLMRTYIENSSQPGQTVFDPFAGAGSTGIAAAELGRKFIGCEADPEYFRVAASRLGIEIDDTNFKGAELAGVLAGSEFDDLI